MARRFVRTHSVYANMVDGFISLGLTTIANRALIHANFH